MPFITSPTVAVVVAVTKGTLGMVCTDIVSGITILPRALVAVMENVYSPVRVAVPVMAPVAASSARPGGSAPSVTAKAASGRASTVTASEYGALVRAIAATVLSLAAGACSTLIV